MRVALCSRQEIEVTYVYDDDVHIDERRHVVYCWLRNQSGDRVRVEATRKQIEDDWKIDWSDTKAVIAEFQKRKMQYLDRAWQAPDAPGSRSELRVYVIGQ
jgi:hypothetical protein